MNLKTSLLALALGLATFTASLHAQLTPSDVLGAPAAIDYQGKVLDANGAPLSATATNYSIQFRLWNDQSATDASKNLVWAESQIVTVDTDGTFSVRLGTGAAILNAQNVDIGNIAHNNLKGAFNGDQRYLGVTVLINGVGTEIIPRLQFLTSPYSLVSETARNVTQTTGTSTFTTATVTNGTITNGTIANATINGGTIKGNGTGLTALNASNITSGTIDAARLPGGIAYSGVNNNFVPQNFNSNDFNNGQWLVMGTRSGNLQNSGITNSFGFGIERFGALTLNQGSQDGDGVIGINGKNIFITTHANITPNAVAPGAAGIIVDTNNAVGIGGFPNGFKLDVFGGLRCSGAVNTSSDARYKKEIRPVTGALETISALRGVSYDWNREAFPAKNFPQGRSIGFIAQEIEKVLPEVVSKDTDGFYSVAYSEVIPVLVEATKELRNENAGLRASLAEQGKRLAELEAANKARDGKLAAIEKLLLESGTPPEPRTAALKPDGRH